MNKDGMFRDHLSHEKGVSQLYTDITLVPLNLSCTDIQSDYPNAIREKSNFCKRSCGTNRGTRTVT